MAVTVEHQGSRSPALRLGSVLTDFFLLLSTTVSVQRRVGIPVGVTVLRPLPVAVE